MKALRLVVLIVLLTPATALAASAPGAPGDKALWTEADKDGFGTAQSARSKVWHTLDDGELTEVYYPDLGTPAVRDLQFIVSDGRTFAERERESTDHRIELTDPRSLTYRQVNSTDRYRITKTYVTDPTRNALVIDVRFQSLTGKKLDLYTLFDPALSNGAPPPPPPPAPQTTQDDDSGSTAGDVLVTQDAKAGSALAAAPGFIRTSNGYLGTSDGWTDLGSDFRMDWTYASAPNGNVVQTGKTALDGVKHQRMTLVVGFGADGAAARSTARAALGRGYDGAAASYARGWHDYLGGLKSPPDSARGLRTDYDVSVMTLAAHEDKRNPGAYIASPSMPWVWATSAIENPSGAYHLVWSRDLYEIATALLAAGDRAGAGRALTFLLEKQQNEDGCFPQNSTVDGADHWLNIQLDEAAFPIVLAWQLRRTDDETYRHVKLAAACILAHGPKTDQERWENQSGWSPATIAAEIAGLVTGAQIVRANGDTATAAAWEAKADEWQGKVDEWTYTTTGNYGKGYYLRLTKDGNPNAPTTYSIGDSGPTVDQRDVVDPSYLELVRLGIKRANDPHILSTLHVVDKQLGVDTPNGEFWHRFSFDGYGEQKDGSQWNFGFPANTTEPLEWKNNVTIGRVWPIFAGERGEYELAAGRSADAHSRLAAMARAGGEGHMIPEQVWDDFLPSGKPGFPTGEATLSASPLAWSHAQFVRLAWSIDAGRPIERPAVVACRYAGCG
jgi:glucoamylase